MKKIISEKTLLVLLLTSIYSVTSYANFSAAMHENTLALDATKDERYIEAGRHYEQAVALGFSKKYGLWKAVDMYVTAEAYGTALTLMKKMAKNGATEMDYFKSLSSKFVGEYLEAYNALLSQVERNSVNSSNQVVQNNLEPGVIHTEDVKRFFKAFDLADQVNSKAEKLSIYKSHYFDEASKGMVDYASMKIGSIDEFVDYVEANRKFYEDVRDASQKIEALIPAAKAAMKKMKIHVPDASDPDIYFIVGMHTSGGTASDNGILLGADFIAESRDHIGNLDEWTHQYITDAEDKVWVVIHEYVHVLQNTKHETVLGNALVEGGADFLANLTYAPPKKPSGYTQFGEANEARIKAKFAASLDSNDIIMWTGNNGHELPDDWVPDLGYFIGHQIAKAYYQQAKDKSLAVQELLTLSDPHKILTLSGYLSDNTLESK